MKKLRNVRNDFQKIFHILISKIIVREDETLKYSSVVCR